MLSQRKPADLVKKIRTVLGTNEKLKTDKVTKNLELLKHQFDADPTVVSRECVESDFCTFVIARLELMGFEAQNTFCTLFCALLHREVSKRYVTVEKFAKNSTLTDLLIKGSANQSTYLQSGKMLRECIQYPMLCSVVFETRTVWDLFDIVQQNDFDLSSGGFATLKQLFLTKDLSTTFFNKNRVEFFKRYRSLIQTSNYVTKRESLHLLGDILLDKANYNFMSSFVQSSTNLKVIMNLLIEKSKSVQYEAFHIFKLFLANPQKTDLVLEIFLRNREQLRLYIDNFHPKEEDEQLEQEKEYLISHLNSLK